MYAVMVKSEKYADLLAREDPTESDLEIATYIDGSMNDLRGWMESIKIRCNDERTFAGAVLGPIRLVAEYMKDIRGMSQHTFPVTGWVFQKSEAWIDTHIERVAISMVVPDLRSCMSLRITKQQASAIGKGAHKFGQVYPVPMTNRLHSPKLTFERVDEAHNMADWDFMKVSIDDIVQFDDSIEMDNYCEVMSMQSKRKLQLGAPFIISGSVVSVNGDMVTIKSSITGSKITAMYAPMDQSSEFDAESVASNHGLFLVVVWYVGNRHKSEERIYAEMVHFDALEPSSDPKLVDLIGYVRLRGSVCKEDLVNKYVGVDYSQATCLIEKNGLVEYVTWHSKNPVFEKFLMATKKIRDTWTSYKPDTSLQLKADDIISADKVNEGMIKSKLLKYTTLRFMLSYIQTRFDETGEWIQKPDGDIDKRNVRELKYMDLLDADTDVPTVTKFGRRMLGIILETEMKRQADCSEVFYMPEFAGDVPRSIMSAYLEGRDDFSNVELPDGRNRLIWIKNNADGSAVIKEIVQKISHSHRSILDAIRTANHPINPMMVSKELSKKGTVLDYYSIHIMLEQISRTGRLINSGRPSDAGLYWKYDLYWRVRDALEYSSDQVWDSGKMWNKVGIGRLSDEDVLSVMKRLVDEGRLVALPDNKWVRKTDDSDPLRPIATDSAKNTIIAVLKPRRSGMDVKDLRSRVEGALSIQFGHKLSSARSKVVMDAISDLEQEGKIRVLEGVYKLT